MSGGHIVGTIRIEPLAGRAPAKPRTGDATLLDTLVSFAQYEHLAAVPRDPPQRLVARRLSRGSASEPADAFARANLAALMEELEAELAEAVGAAS
jgi:hypothetical protein